MNSDYDWAMKTTPARPATRAEVAGIQCAIAIPYERLAQACRRWGISKLELFGSVLRDDFDPERSDVDVLVTFEPEARPGWDLFSKLPAELSELFRRPVDLLERAGIEQSANYLRRQHILDNSVVVYEG